MNRRSGKQDPVYQLFIQEAQTILQQIQEGLLELPHQPTTFKIHYLIQAAHTIKSGAAQVQLTGIQRLAEQLEHVFRLIHQDHLVIDSELVALLLQAYECLRLPLMTQRQTRGYDAIAALAEAKPIFAQLKAKLQPAPGSADGDLAEIERSTHVAELILSTEVAQALEHLETVLAHPENYDLAEELKIQSDVFLGFGEMLTLPEFVAISQTTLSALQASPQMASTIGQMALAGLRAVQRAALKDDGTASATPRPAPIRDRPLPVLPDPPFHSPLEQARAIVQASNSAVADSPLNLEPKTDRIKITLVNTLKGPELRLKTANSLVWINGLTAFTLPSANIEEILIPESDQLICSRQQRFLHWHDRMIPVHCASALLGEAANDATTNGSAVNPSSKPIIVLRQNQQHLALEVEIERLVTASELTIEPSSEAIALPPYAYGFMRWNNRLIQVVDGIALLNQTVEPVRPATIGAEETGSMDARRASVPLESHTEIPAAATVLVVDDSTTMQGMVSSTLERAGYQVLQARDGQEAIAKLQHHAAVQLVISDIEMPNMNGFEFLNYRRKDPLLSKIPVVIISTRSTKQYRQLASQLGATAYFTKPYNETDLLATIHLTIHQSNTA